MAAVEWDAQCSKLRELMRLWESSGDVKKGSSELASVLLALKGEERRRFWAKGFYSEAERAVRLNFDWRDPDTGASNRDWRAIEITVKSQPRPWENLTLLVTALNDVRLAFKRGNVRIAYGVLNQFWPPATGGAPRIIYRDRIVHQRMAAHPAGSPFAVLHVDEDAPYEVCQAAYRALSKLAHPDRGGSHDQQKVLNAAWQEIEATHPGRERAS